MKTNHERYYLRKKRVQRKVRGSSERPRLTVFRSLKHIYAQVIDDMSGNVLAASSTTLKDLKNERKNGIAKAALVGEDVAKKAIAKGITKVMFDRGGWPVRH